MILKCHGCGSEKETDSPPKEFVCKVCGAVNLVVQGDGTASEACGCIPPKKEFGWTLPAGESTDPVGNKLFQTAQGTWMTKGEYIEAFGLDPEITVPYMRKLGREGKEGFYNTSTLGRKAK